MDFLAEYFVHGILFAGPVDRSLFPVQVETDHAASTIADQAQRFELAGNDRILVRRGRLVNGAFEEDTHEWSGATLLLDADGYIRWGGGNIEKTWEITSQDGRLISGSEGLLQPAAEAPSPWR